ncbi:MAG: hypothetical protein KBT10_09185 [Bacteroidales bacterium]|nr:hypothetical protein [Candidatus Sodaliphilus aphodohippi]
MMRHIIIFLLPLFVCISACSNSDEEKLRTEILETSSSSAIHKKSPISDVTISQSKDYELKLNKKYVADLQNLVENSFEEQLTKFEDQELGVIASYRYMFKYLSYSDTEWNDLQAQLSDRYFNTLQVQQKTFELGKRYQNDIIQLRSRFYSNKNKLNAPQIHMLNLPKSDVYLGELDSHSGTNLVVEIGTTILDILLGTLITWFVFNILGCLSGCGEFVVFIITTIIVIIVSVMCTNYNDGKIIDALRQQKQEQIIDYSSIEQTLNNNTISFYETQL